MSGEVSPVALERLKAYAKLLDLDDLSETEFEEVVESAAVLLGELGQLWRYDLTGIHTSLAVSTTGRH